MKTLATALIAVATLSAASQASGNCGPKDKMSEALASQFGETPFASGISANSAVKFFGNPLTGTWSVVVIKPDGMSCVVAIGEGLEVGISPAKAAEGASF